MTTEGPKEGIHNLSDDQLDEKIKSTQDELFALVLERYKRTGYKIGKSAYKYLSETEYYAQRQKGRKIVP